MALKWRFVEASDKQYAAGSAIGNRVRIKLEDHSITKRIKAKLVDFIVDLDIEGKGWYLASLDTAAPIISDPVTEVLVRAKGALEDPRMDRPTHDAEGNQISYYYKNPMEEMLLNEKSKIKYLLGHVGTIKDPVILREKRLVHSQIQIYEYATIWRK
jgi:hypothetical protein